MRPSVFSYGRKYSTLLRESQYFLKLYFIFIANIWPIPGATSYFMQFLHSTFSFLFFEKRFPLLLTLARKKFVELGKEGLPCLPAF